QRAKVIEGRPGRHVEACADLTDGRRDAMRLGESLDEVQYLALAIREPCVHGYSSRQECSQHPLMSSTKKRAGRGQDGTASSFGSPTGRGLSPGSTPAESALSASRSDTGTRARQAHSRRWRSRPPRLVQYGSTMSSAAEPPVTSLLESAWATEDNPAPC